MAVNEVVNVVYRAGLNNHQPDVQAAINQAILKTKEGKSVEVRFPKGSYFHDGLEKYFINVKGANNLIINGNGSKVDILRFNLGFATTTNSKNVVIMGFEVDYPKERTFLEGKITALDSKTNKIEVVLERTSPTYDDAYVKKGIAHMCLLDPVVNGRLKSGAGSFFRFQRDSTQKTGERMYTLKAAAKLSTDFKVGDRFVDFLRNGGATSMCFAQAIENLTFYDITSYGTSGGHYVVLASSILNVLRCNALIKDGRWFGGNADGVHCRGLKIGPWVEGCKFSGIGDDAIALYSRPMVALGPARESNLVLKSEFYDLEQGDEIALFNPLKGEIILETKVKSLDNNRKVILEKLLINPLRTGVSIVEDDQIWNRSKSCGDFVVRNNTFENIRRYGTVFRAKGGIVENNTYQGTSSSAIMSCNEPQYPNGLFCSDIIIISNKIKDYNFSTRSYAAITLALHGRYGNAMSFGPRNILLQNNQIEFNGQVALQAESAQNLALKRNRINDRMLDYADMKWVLFKNTQLVNWISEK